MQPWWAKETQYLAVLFLAEVYVFCYFVESHFIFECPSISFHSKMCPHYLDTNQ